MPGPCPPCRPRSFVCHPSPLRSKLPASTTATDAMLDARTTSHALGRPRQRLSACVSTIMREWMNDAPSPGRKLFVRAKWTLPPRPRAAIPDANILACQTLSSKASRQLSSQRNSTHTTRLIETERFSCATRGDASKGVIVRQLRLSSTTRSITLGIYDLQPSYHTRGPSTSRAWTWGNAMQLPSSGHEHASQEKHNTIHPPSWGAESPTSYQPEAHLRLMQSPALPDYPATCMQALAPRVFRAGRPLPFPASSVASLLWEYTYRASEFTQT